MASNKERSPAMQFYFRQFAGDENVMAMDLDAVGAHILLMCAAGASEFGYRLAYDLAQIRTRLRNPSASDFERIMSQLLAGPWKLSADKKYIEQDGMRRTLQKQKEFSKKQRENAARRWHRSGIDLAHAKTCPTSTSTSSTSSSKVCIYAEGKIKHGSYVWLSEIEFDQYLVSVGSKKLNRAIEKLNGWIGKDPADPQKIFAGQNASATFQNWVFLAVEEEFARAEKRKNKHFAKPTTFDLNQDLIEELKNESTRKN